MKVLNAGFSLVTSTLTKVLGAQVLKDMQTFVTAFDTMFGGFRERADSTYRLLQTPGTAFLVVAAPEPDALREASYFVERLAGERMPLAGLILNRVHVPAGGQAVRRAAAWPPRRRWNQDQERSGGDIRRGRRTAALRARGRRFCGCTRSGCNWRPGTAGGRALHLGPPRRSRDRSRRAARGRPRPRGLAHDRFEASPAEPGTAASGSARHRAASTIVHDCLLVLSRACSSSSRQEVTSGRRRSSARRSRSVIPPQTPNSMPLSSASARHSVRTGQPRQISLARFCAAPWTNSSSGSVPLHAARVVQSVIHMCPLLLIVEHCVHGRSCSMGCDPGLARAAALPRLPVRDKATYGSPGRCQGPGMAIYGIVLLGHIQPERLVTLRMRSCPACGLIR